MPWRRRWRWNNYRRRYRWPWRRRFRKTFRRRWRRRVRPKRKLKRLKLTQWQPSCIRLSKVKGIMCLFLCNKYRLSNNLAIYDASIVPEKLPGGGGISIYKFSLDSLFTMHQFCRNWWTYSNAKLPLVRYLKCVLKIYRSEDVDIAFRYQRNPPFTASNLTYSGTQPSMLMMLNHTKLIPSKRTKPKGKDYVKITIKPPEHMINKWYFQQQLATQTLLITTATAASFDHYYIGTDKMSNNCTIYVLNTNMFQNRNFGKNDLYHIREDGTQKVWLWASNDSTVSLTQQHPLANTLTLLANGKSHVEGWDFDTYKVLSKDTTKDWTTFKQHIHLYTGNPFHENYFNPEKLEQEHFTLYISRGADPGSTLPDSESKRAENLILIHNPLVYKTRYNPNTDNGSSNITYLLENYKPLHGWDEPPNHKLINEGFPLYINWWSYLDFQKRQHEVTNIDTSQIMVTKTNTLHGGPSPSLNTFVPLNEDFVWGNSPFEKGVNPADHNRWYPMVQYQEQAVNVLLSTGPGVAKLNGKNTVEAKMKYIFYFKFGGNPAPMVDVSDPTKQPIFPMPSNIIQTNSLQDPTTPPELFMYNFDQRRNMLTRQATERIVKNWLSSKSLFTDGTTTPPAPETLETFQTTSEEETDSEKEAPTLLQQLRHQRRKQHKLKRRIKQLIQLQQLNL
nr:MAG: ORF1 [TTV-like mini virus]